MVPNYIPDAQQALAARLTGRLAQTPQLRAEVNAVIVQGVRAQLDGMEAEVEVDDRQRRLSVAIAPEEGLDESALAALGEALRLRVPGWSVIVWTRDPPPPNPALVPIAGMDAHVGMPR